MAAGFAPMYAERALDNPALAAARTAVEQILKAHEPFPASAVDRHWNLVFRNTAADALLQMGIAPGVLQPPVNALRLSLHPDGLAPCIVNLAQWRAHLFKRLHHQIGLTADTTLAALAGALAGAFAGYPAPLHDGAAAFMPNASIVVPLVLDTPFGRLSFISRMTMLGTPVEITLSELALETIFPADAVTAAALRQMAGSG